MRVADEKTGVDLIHGFSFATTTRRRDRRTDGIGTTVGARRSAANQCARRRQRNPAARTGVGCRSSGSTADETGPDYISAR